MQITEQLMWLNLHSVVSGDLIMPACLGYVLNNDQRFKYCVSVPGESACVGGGETGELEPPTSCTLLPRFQYLYLHFPAPYFPVPISCKFQVLRWSNS